MTEFYSLGLPNGQLNMILKEFAISARVKIATDVPLSPRMDTAYRGVGSPRAATKTQSHAVRSAGMTSGDKTAAPGPGGCPSGRFAQSLCEAAVRRRRTQAPEWTDRCGLRPPRSIPDHLSV
jgi:hypothetical protein